MGELYKSESDDVARLYDIILPLIKGEDFEVVISALMNLLIIYYYTFGFECKMDSEEFILYINKNLEHLKSELLRQDRLEKLENNRGI